MGLAQAAHPSRGANMAKSPRTKITDVLDQADLDGQAKAALKKGGGPMAKHAKHHTAEAEKAELASYKLNRKKF